MEYNNYTALDPMVIEKVLEYAGTDESLIYNHSEVQTADVCLTYIVFYWPAHAVLHTFLIQWLNFRNKCMNISVKHNSAVYDSVTLCDTETLFYILIETFTG